MSTPHLTSMPQPRLSAAWLLSGPDLPTRVGVGAPGCEASVLLDVASRDNYATPYTKAVRITAGAIAIAGAFTTGSGDFIRAAATGEFAFDGARTAAPSDVAQPPLHTPLADDLETTTWTVRTPRGHFLFVKPQTQGLDQAKGASAVLATLQEFLHGACAISRVDTGLFTTLPTYASREMSLILADG